MKLFDYQIEDAKWLASRKMSGLFSGMGTGKTRVALEACVLSEAVKILIVGPPISLPMWQTEAADHLGRDDIVILRTGKAPIGNANIVICSYAIATARRIELAGLGWDVLIMDESHAIKTPDAKRTQALVGYDGSIADHSDKVFFLTGSPAVRWADDLYTFLARACPEELSEKIGGLSLDKFRLRYCVTQIKQFGSGRYRKKVIATVGNRNEDELNELMFKGGCAKRRTLAEVAKNMPDFTITQTEIELDTTAEFREQLKAVGKMTISQIHQDLQSAEPALAEVRRKLGEAKVKAAVKELVSRISEGHGPILVGCWHRNVIDGLTEGLVSAGIKLQVIDGRTSFLSKQAIQDSWNAGIFDILIAQTAAAGVSLNLQQGGHNIVELEQDWSPAIQAQLRARLYRIGQKLPVHVDVWGSDTKLDKAISQISKRKAIGHTKMLAQEEVA